MEFCILSGHGIEMTECPLTEEHWTRFLKRRLKLEKESRISPRLVVRFPSRGNDHWQGGRGFED